MSKRSTYHAALEATQVDSVTALTPRSLAAVTPHLTNAERAEILSQVESGKDVAFVAPPLSVDGSVFVLRASPGYAALAPTAAAIALAKGLLPTRTPMPARIDVVRAERIPDPSAAKSVPHVARAIEYARKHWGASLTTETWASTHRVIISDESMTRLGLTIPKGSKDLIEVAFTSSLTRAEIFETGSDTDEPAQIVESSILRILPTQVERVECGLKGVVVWDDIAVPASVLAYLSTSFAKAA